jgi:radical SAM superfamily enzyme YgiQ (UPF0313 family)
MPGPYRRLLVILVRPSRYDDDGYVVRHWRGTLPSNTLSCLNSLTQDVVSSGSLGVVEVRVEVIDEIVSRVDPGALGRCHRRDDTKVVVGLAGVQTNQFPRARDLARQFRAQGFDVIIGGFHVSGAMAMSQATPPECQEMLDAGITLVLGEVEGRWGGILRDVLADRLQPLYNFLQTPPDLTDMPLPRASHRTQKRFVMSRNGTIDVGRGCPFSCSFCTIINVQGRTMRSRSAAHVIDQIRQNYWLKGRRGVHHYFLTDDNFARNPQWERIFDGLVALREKEALDIDFMMQVDTQAPKIPRFVEKAARAGCVQVFIGMESVRDDNLQAGGKPQNRAAEYREMVARWHEVGVVCHAGFIIGFPHDTYARVMEDVRTLSETMLVDHASFFMLTPIPGSRDHQAAVQSGIPLDADYNNYDSFHATVPHPRMSRDEWDRAFRDAWVEFYSFEHMRRALLSQNPHTYWPVLKTFLWYRAGMIEGAHPMVTGFFRLKDRTSRRPGFPIEARWPFFKRRAADIEAALSGYLKLYFEMQELWLLTRIRRDDYWFLGDLRGLGPRSVRAVKLAWGRVHAAAAVRLASMQQRIGVETAGLSATMRERLEAVREVLGSRAAALCSSIADPSGARAQNDDPIPSATGSPAAERLHPVQAALADLRLPELPPPAPPSRFTRPFTRVNPLSLDRLEYNPALAAYWRGTRRSIRRLELWRLNPLELLWNLVHGTRQALSFLVAMRGERY